MTTLNEELLDEVAGLVVQGNGLKADFAAAVSGMTVELSVDQMPQVTLVVEDPDLKLWSRGLFRAGTPTTAGSPVAWRNTRWEVAAVEIGAGQAPGGFQVEIRPETFQRLSRQAGEQVWNDLSASDWIASRVRAAGGTVVVQPSAAPQPQIVREGGVNAESDLDVADKLASAEKRSLFWAFGTVYYAAPTWLAAHRPVKKLRWPTGGDFDLLGVPKCRRSADDKDKAATISASVHRRHALDLLTLPVIDAGGISQFEGRYLLTSLTWRPGVPEPLELGLATPVDPKPDVDADTGGDVLGIPLPDFAQLGPSPVPSGGPTARNMVQIALRQAGDVYHMGAGRNLKDGDPDQFDCSGLVYWSSGQLGVHMPQTAEGQYNRCVKERLLIDIDTALRTIGALLFVIYPGNNPSGKYDHVAISMGDGLRTIEARGTKYGVNVFDGAARRNWTAAAYAPGLAYQ